MGKDKLDHPVLLYDSLDKPNADSNSSYIKQTHTFDSRVIRTAIFVCSGFVGVLALYVIVWLNLNFYTYGAFWLGVLHTGVIVFLIAFLAIILIWLLTWTFRHMLVDLRTSLPMSMFDASQAAYAKHYQTILQREYAVLEARANKSEFQGVQNLSLDRSSDVSTTTVGQDTPQLAAPVIDVREPDKSLLRTLQDKGHINRSNKSLMIGYAIES